MVKNRSRRRARTSDGDAVGKYASDAWSLAKRTAQGLKELSKLINIEHKIIDNELVAQATSQAGAVYLLSGVAEGLTARSRVGESLRFSRCELRMKCNIHASGVNSVVRLLLVRDLENQGAAPIGADVLETVSTASSVLTPYDFQNTTNFSVSGRFTIISDQTIVLSAAGAGKADASVVMPMTQHARFRGTGATIASCAEGVLLLFAFTDEPTNTPTLDFSCRLWFIDD